MLNLILTTDTREPMRGDVALSAPSRAYKSGADGYYFGGKVTIDGVQYQLSCNVVRIGSKDEAGAEERRTQVAALEAAKAQRMAARKGGAVEASDEQ